MDGKKNIVHVEDDVYVVNGKVICFTSDILNMDNPRDVDEVLTLSEVLYVEKGYSAIHGKDTMCVLVKHSDGEHYMISMACIFDLPEDVQEKVRQAIKEQKKEASVFEEEVERIEPTDSEKNIYYGVRNYFDYAVHLMEQITGLRMDAEYAEQILREYLASEGYMYYDATYQNIPWMLLYFCIAKPVYGKLVHKKSPLYEMLKDRSDVVLKPIEGRDYYKVDKSGDWLDLQYSFILHERKVVDDEVKEEIHFQLFSSDKQDIPAEEADTVLDINECLFFDFIQSGDAAKYRNDELLQIASRLMPDL